MTNGIEGKIREIIQQAIDNFLVGNDEAKDQSSQAILELMKPMSREGLLTIIHLHLYGSIFNGYDETEKKLADAILAEWEKGVK